jgi:hypothetical protein
MLDVVWSAGNISDIYPAILIFALSVTVVAYGAYLNRFLDVAPTLSWALLMQAPFILQSGLYRPENAWIQSDGIFIMGCAIAIGDCYSLFNKDKIQYQPTNINTKPLLVVCIIGLIVLPLYHLSQVESTPFFDRLIGDFGAGEIAQKREQFGKELNINIFYKYGIQWVSTLFGPLAFYLLVIRKKYIFALVVCFWIIAYSILSTARLPVLLFLFFSAMSIAHKIPARLRKFIGLMIYICCIGFLVLSLQRLGEIQDWYAENKSSNLIIKNYNESVVAKDPNRNITLNDLERIEGVIIPGKFSPTVNFLIYRIFLSPVDVSHNWYTYYGWIAQEKRSFWDLIHRRNGGFAASNLVGQWAYYERFPNRYLSTVSAYGSIDADAYSFGGMLGVLLISLTYLSLRIYAARLNANAATKFIASLMICYFIVFLIQASLQAILIAQGLLMLVFISLLFSLEKIHAKSKYK